jgi:hypothetical protein
MGDFFGESPRPERGSPKRAKHFQFDQMYEKKPRYADSLPKVSEGTIALAADITFWVGNVKSLLNEYDEVSLLSALNVALPGQVRRQFNPNGNKSLAKLLEELNEALMG